MKDVCDLVRLEYIQFYQLADQHQDLGVREGGGGGVSSVTEEPLAFTTPFFVENFPP